jgi:O-antigen ligase
MYLEIAAENGLVGLTFFLSAVVVTLRDLSRARRRWLHTRPDDANLASAFLLVIVAYLSTAIFLHLSYARYFWLMFGLATVASGTEEEPAVVTATAKKNVAALENHHDLLTSSGVAI